MIAIPSTISSTALDQLPQGLALGLAGQPTFPRVSEQLEKPWNVQSRVGGCVRSWGSRERWLCQEGNPQACPQCLSQLDPRWKCGQLFTTALLQERNSELVKDPKAIPCISQSHRTVWVGKDLENPSIPTPLP